jgi:hypothetical protein
MNNNDNNEEPEAALPALESLDDYIRRFGLTHAGNDDSRNGEFNGLTRHEAANQISAERRYLDSVLERHFDDSCESDGGQNKNNSSSVYCQLSDEEDGAVILVLLSNDSTHTALVKPLVSLCETIRRAVHSRSRFGVAKSDSDCQDVAESNDPTKSKSSPIMQLSLTEYNSDAVVQFIDAVVSLFHHISEKQPATKSSDSKKRRINENAQSQHIVHLIEKKKISEDHIVECLRIAHYLQCTILLETLASVLESSIDSQNCMSICSLADFYNLQSLFEASVNHVVTRLDALQGKPDDDNEEKVNDAELSENERMQQDIWQSLPHELRSRILTMRNVMRSSVIGRGSKVSGVFFSSGDEFLAIFQETLCDQRERLAEARERRNEVIREREAEWDIIRQRRGRWFDSSEEAKHAFVYGGDAEYALSKIEKQEQRIKTLESFYQEQKVIFRSSSFGASNVVL